jgi:hypothetical protein
MGSIRTVQLRAVTSPHVRNGEQFGERRVAGLHDGGELHASSQPRAAR